MDYFTRKNYVITHSVEYECDGQMNGDAYRINVFKSGRAVINYGCERGRSYAEETFKSLSTAGGLPVCELSDEPSFEVRGIVEGFYGQPYSFDVRRDMLRFMRRHRMNAYFFAPKDDPYHRIRWREDYPREEAEKLAKLIEESKNNHVDFYYCISPGLDFDYTSAADYAVITAKLQSVARLGADSFALLFDDIPVKLSSAAEKVFVNAGAAHARLANYLAQNLVTKNPLIVCPTDYFQPGATAYRDAFGSALAEGIRVFWTGYNTVAEAVTASDGVRAAAAFGRPLVLWDNYPVNDFHPKRRLYLGPLCNRSVNLPQTHIGYVANPMPKFYASMPALITAADYMWNAQTYDQDAAARRAAKELAPDCEKEFLFFTEMNRGGVLEQSPCNYQRFQTGDFEYLDLYYRRAEDCALTLGDKLEARILGDLRSLLDYVLYECAFYRSLRQGHADIGLLKAMTENCCRTADQSLIMYAKDIGIDGAITESERAVYWKNEI